MSEDVILRQPSPLAREIAAAVGGADRATAAPAGVPDMAAGVAISAAGNIVAALPIAWPVKALIIGGPLLYLGWRWIRGRKF